MIHQLIIGHGYLGSRIASILLETGAAVTVTSRQYQEGGETIPGQLRQVYFNLNEETSWQNLEFLAGEPLDLYFLLPPSQLDLSQLEGFLDYIQGYSLRRVVLSSSTVVYPNGGERVDADSEVFINGERAVKQWQIEDLFRSAPLELRIVRLAGIYGPGRVIGKKQLLDGMALKGSGDAWLNLVHVLDAAELLVRVMQSDEAGPVELGCDGKPVKRSLYYQDLASYLKCAEAIFEGEDDKNSKGRRCSNTPSCRRTGWQPKYLDYRQAWEAF